ncbi:Lpg1974 family pore-forming outer membrane protein [Vacuolonema iberomarrocanum]|uniref:Lpg1974 family pore-forming outer membrane protein n=1 Tax=Vacuolonema iberomarrocanum TaxID=3454632 RepID=UPI0019EEDD76|nr:BBP7 family outer membrane beta-barrel protein [filamentous cyanobacterium LEGE 07170]
MSSHVPTVAIAARTVVLSGVLVSSIALPAAASKFALQEVVETTMLAQDTVEADEPDASSSNWSVSAELLLLDREVIDTTTTLDRNTDEEFGTESLGFEFDPGTRLTLNYHLSPRDSLEITGLGFVNHSDEDTFTSSIQSPGGEVLAAAFEPDATDPAASNFAQAFQQTLDYSSEATNVELGYRHTLPRASSGWQGSFLAGLRYFNLDEDLTFRSIDEDPEIFPSTSVGRYSIDTDNEAIGIQIGGDLSYQVSSDFEASLRLRTGLLLNSASQESRIRNDIGGSIVTTSGDESETELSPVVEVGAFLNWNVSPDVSLSAGYMLLLLGNMALAPDQFATSNDFGRSLSGLERDSVLFHGPSFGLRVRF